MPFSKSRRAAASLAPPLPWRRRKKQSSKQAARREAAYFMRYNAAINEAACGSSAQPANKTLYIPPQQEMPPGRG